MPKFNWSPYPYCLIVFVPLLPAVGYLLGMDWLFIGVTFAAMPILDLIIGDNHEPFGFSDKEIRIIEGFIALYLLVHVFVIYFGAYLVESRSASIPEILLFAGLTGFACAGQGFSVAHEIGHDKPRWKQLGAKLILMCQCYGQFKAEHNRGHHVRAATREDVVFSPKNRSVYAFLPKVIIGSFIDGAKLEAEALRRKGKSPWSFGNEVIQLALGSVLIAASLWLLFGWRGLLFFFVQALFSIIILETVEYIQHYGLERRKDEATGKHERMGPEHSWNAPQMFSNYLTLNLQRHPDHHANPGRVYYELESHKTAPHLPTGYPGLIGLALIPPLWFWIMNPRLEAFLEKQDTPSTEVQTESKAAP